MDYLHIRVSNNLTQVLWNILHYIIQLLVPVHQFDWMSSILEVFIFSITALGRFIDCNTVLLCVRHKISLPSVCDIISRHGKWSILTYDDLNIMIFNEYNSWWLKIIFR